MTITFTGFQQLQSMRHFAFDCVATDRSRTTVTVCADLALARKHHILMQELPLLCLRLLEQRPDLDLTPLLTLTEANMAAVEAAVLTLAATRKENRRAPAATGSLGHAWRQPHVG